MEAVVLGLQNDLFDWRSQNIINVATLPSESDKPTISFSNQMIAIDLLG